MTEPAVGACKGVGSHVQREQRHSHGERHEERHEQPSGGRRREAEPTSSRTSTPSKGLDFAYRNRIATSRKAEPNIVYRKNFTVA